MNRFPEIWEELKSVFSGRGSLFDSIIPPVIFLMANGLGGLQAATWVSLASVASISLFRILKRQSLWFALGGLAAALAAVGLSSWMGRQEAYYLPSIINGVGMTLLFLVSLLFKRPMAAYTSYLMRRWPLIWYWRNDVRPAYSEVTLLWTLLFGLRLAVQIVLFQQKAASTLAWLDVLMGWPFLIVILVISYLYGLWRLKNLGGPSVEEWKNKVPPPWQSQRRGF